LDFSHGINFAKDILSKFNKEVHPRARSGSFIMVVSFGRASFKLEDDSVGIALEAVLGGFCGQLKASLIRYRVFSFCVSCKDVGFHILKLRKFSCEKFKCFFHLWGRGGPNWKWEFQRWQKECDEEWTMVSPSRKVLQHGLAALKMPTSKPILGKSNGLGKKLSFAPSIDYDACLGYQDPKLVKEKEKAPVEEFVTSSVPNITFVPVSPYPFKQQRVGVEEESLSRGMLGSQGNVQAGVDDFENMIDDMAYKVWSCGKCLNMGHLTKDCTNEVRCRSCYSYGHVRKNCLARSKGKIWVRKEKPSNMSTRVLVDKEVCLSGATDSTSTLVDKPVEPVQQPSDHINSNPSPVSAAPSSSQAMAVFEVDPTPWLPWGHEIIDGGPTRLPRDTSPTYR
jgi:hypothetical protein